ncbi:MAG: hypothetical protein HKN23_03945 [Verrucomicrobiales bacterium]|nr:hypothetical protein [Verrucomicrobiales bacterium]
MNRFDNPELPEAGTTPRCGDCEEYSSSLSTRRAFVVVPVEPQDESGLATKTLDHLHSAGVASWATILFVRADSESLTRSELFNRGMKDAVSRGAKYVFWLRNGCLPRVGAMERLLEISRCRRAIAAVGRNFPVGHEGNRKTWFGSRIIQTNKTEISPVDWAPDYCTCLPAVAIGNGFRPGIPDHWAAEDFCLSAGKRGIPCLVVGSAAVDHHSWELSRVVSKRPSWLLGDESIFDTWKKLNRRGNMLNPKVRFRFFLSHWGFTGLVPACSPYFRLAVITILRGIFPIAWLRKFYGNRSEAWQLQRAYRSVIKT